MGGVLSGDQIRSLCVGDEPLLTDYRDLDQQVQPNGFDLTMGSIHTYSGTGRIGVAIGDRVLPDLVALDEDADGWFRLAAGPYHVVFNEAVRLPLDVMAFGRPRSSVCRGGAAIHTAVWDAGYHGRSSSLLIVSNLAGLALERHARILQLVFVRLDRPAGAGYDGAYQGERLGAAAAGSANERRSPR